MFPLPKPVFKKTLVDPEIPQFKWEDLGKKPGNILVSNQHYCSITEEKEFRDLWESRPIICRLTDFGESKSSEIQTKTLMQTKTARLDRGTPTYMAPEILLLEN